ncbi:hypothetical protein DCAR_0522597 [Daucus carota subsp. sativus]|uniref:Uncharacterized protein n=1 Tax=Daucus carota subsp. sativus TaxID=79200 RepID=A0A164ZW98_DAUCS|nr:PREDICTED: uncharacterized protein LOC108222376 [Daucus carota subsp. sativus]WOH03201.1 hypothetical protein DCAR_0522597 [Daucus carota subsp. sativus]
MIIFSHKPALRLKTPNLDTMLSDNLLKPPNLKFLSSPFKDSSMENPDKNSHINVGRGAESWMGMGKMVQAIALVLARLREVKATLVVCALVAMSQWVNEINRFT